MLLPARAPASGARDDEGRQYSAAISPARSAASKRETYAVTISADPANRDAIGSAVVEIPDIYAHPDRLAVLPPPGKEWELALVSEPDEHPPDVVIRGPHVHLHARRGRDRLEPRESLRLELTLSNPIRAVTCEAAAWRTSARKSTHLNGPRFALAGLRPCVEIVEPTSLSVEDPSFEPIDPQRNLQPMPPLPGADDITRVEVTFSPSSVGFRLEVGGPIGAQNQYKIGLDVEQDGDSDVWVWINDPASGSALVSDERFQLLGTIAFSIAADGRTIDLEVPGGVAGQRPSATVFSFDRAVSEVATPLFLLGEPVEAVAVNTASDDVLAETELDPAGFVTFLDDKTSPPKEGPGIVKGDGDGDGKADDYLYKDNSRELMAGPGRGIKIEMWSLDRGAEEGTHDKIRIGYKVIHPDGTSGWIAQCPYTDGYNEADFETRNGIIVAWVHRCVDKGGDDDGDGKKDSVYYRYDFATREHIAAHYENGLLVIPDQSTHVGPHAGFSNLEFWK